MYVESQTELETAFSAGWVQTEVAWENGALDPENLTEFVRFSVQYGDAALICLGVRTARVTGVVFAQIFVRPGVGMSRAMELADGVVAIFNVNKIGRHTMTTAPSVQKFPAEQSGWIQVQVATDFYFDEDPPS